MGDAARGHLSYLEKLYLIYIAWRVFVMALPKLNNRQKRCLRYVLEHGYIDAKIHRRIIPHWHSETLRLDRAKLREWGLLEKRGENKGAYYVPAGKGGEYFPGNSPEPGDL